MPEETPTTTTTPGGTVTPPELASDQHVSLVEKIYGAAIRKGRTALYVTLVFATWCCLFAAVAWKDHMQLATQILAVGVALVAVWVATSVIAEAIIQSNVTRSTTEGS